MEIIDYRECLRDRYDEFVRGHKHALFYQSLKYKEFLEGFLEIESHYKILMLQNEIKAILPIMVKQGRMGKVINSLPFYGSNGGILSSLSEASVALYQHYLEMVNNSDVLSSTLVINPLIETDNLKYCYDYLDKRIGQWTELKDKSRDVLMASFDSSTRRNIRKADKNGVVVKIENKNSDFIYQCHKANMQKIGGLEKSERFFKLILNYFTAGEDYNIYIAYIDGEPVAGLLLFYFNKTVEYFTPVVVAEYRSCQPLAAIIYKAMTDAMCRGFSWWNWGGTWCTQEGVYRFKKKWASIDKPYFYYTCLNNKSVLDKSSEFLLNEYKNFFVLPFSELGEKKHA